MLEYDYMKICEDSKSLITSRSTMLWLPKQLTENTYNEHFKHHN